MKRLLIDFKENHKKEIVGRVDMPADSVFVLEAMALAIVEFSKSCEVPPDEIVRDLLTIVQGNIK